MGSAINGTDTVVQLAIDLPPSVRSGAVLSVDRELMRVLAIDGPAKQATVIRGWQDSNAATHTIGTEVWINPRFTGTDIYEAMVDELTAWGPDLFRVHDEEVAVALGALTLELPVGFIGAYGVIDVRRRPTTNSFGIGGPDTRWPTIDYRVQRASVGRAGTVASGILLRLIDSCRDAGTVYVQAALPFSLSSITADLPDVDLVADVGLAASMVDVLTMGIKIRLLPDAEVQRSSRGAQDEPRRAEEVPAMAAMQTAAQMRPGYNVRKTEEVNRLRRLYPVRWS